MVFFDAYLRGLREAIERFQGEAVVLFMCDGVDPRAVQRAARELHVSPVHATSANSSIIAVVRREMLCAAAALPVDAIACFDMDDIPLKEGLNLHWATLDHADVSYGDMSMIDANGADCGESFFSGADVPEEITTSAELVSRNFMGFTNTAIGRNRVLGAAESIPDDVIAVDWWFFSHLLNTGSVARKTTDSVVAYRTHGANTLGGKGPQGLGALNRACEIMRRHYGRLVGHAPSVVAAASQVASLQERLAEDPDGVLALYQTCEQKDVWFGAVSRLALACQDAR
jgi:hypothetical protein